MMTMTATRTSTATYTTIDIENVVRRVRADLMMIADSTGAWTPTEAANYAHDIELLAKKGYLAWIDLTLLSAGIEIKAVRFEVDTESGSLTSSRPGGVLWPRVNSPHLRIVISYTAAYDDDAHRALRDNLKSVPWVLTANKVILNSRSRGLFHLPKTTSREVFGPEANKENYFQCLARKSSKRRGHEIRRIWSLRDCFRASWHRER